MDPEVFSRAAAHVFYAHAEESVLRAGARMIADRYAYLSPHPRGFDSSYAVCAGALTGGDPTLERTLDLLIENRLVRVAEGSGNGSGLDRSCVPDLGVVGWHARHSSLLERSEY